MFSSCQEKIYNIYFVISDLKQRVTREWVEFLRNISAQCSVRFPRTKKGVRDRCAALTVSSLAVHSQNCSGTVMVFRYMRIDSIRLWSMRMVLTV